LRVLYLKGGDFSSFGKYGEENLDPPPPHVRVELVMVGFKSPASYLKITMPKVNITKICFETNKIFKINDT
jgi:hypothetical protein